MGFLTNCTWVCIAIFFLVGCNDRGGASIRGSVTFNGVPLSDGSVNLYNKEHGTGATAMLGENGSFAVNGSIREGEYLVYFSPPKPRMPDMQNADHPVQFKLDMTTYAKIPKKYLSQATTDYRVNLTAGENVLDLKIQ